MTEKIVQYLLFSLFIAVAIATLIAPSESAPCKCSEFEFLLESGQILTIEHNAPPSILHSGFAPDDWRQEIVAEAYRLGGLEFVTMLECENGLRDPQRVGDKGLSFGLCQLNIRRHWEPLDPHWESWVYQLNICHEKRKWGTKFYGPSRKIWGKKCSEVVKERFYILWDL